MQHKLHLGIYALTLLAGSFGAYASSNADSLKAHKHIVLKEVEITGAKVLSEAQTSSTTTLDSAMISRLGTDNIRGASMLTPNFFMPAYGSRMTSSMYVRGLGARIDNPVMGLKIDNVPVFNKNCFDFDLEDLEKVEVFIGPQSVLSGRNTMGGQINVYTLSPWKYQGLRLKAGYGNANTWQAAAGIYAKLSSKIASSLSAYYTSTDGYYTNEYNGKLTGDEHQVSARWKLSARMSDWHTITNTASFNFSEQSGYPYQEVKTGKINYNDTCFYRRKGFSDGLTAVWAGKRVVVTSATSFQYLNDRMTLDQDFLPQDYFTLTQKQHEWVLSEDLYAKGRRGNYEWTAGAFGFYRDNDMDAPVELKETAINGMIVRGYNMMHRNDPIVWGAKSLTLGSKFHTPTKGIAGYIENSWNPGDFTFDIGLRYSFENTSMTYTNTCNSYYVKVSQRPPVAVPVDILIHNRMKLNSSQLLPKAAVSWRMPIEFMKSNVYASFAEGYKAGGFNTQMFSDALQQVLMKELGLGSDPDFAKMVKYKPEKSFNYEFGVKGESNDGMFGFSAAGFFIDCRDQQLTKFPEGKGTGRMMTNAGRTYSRGFELSARWRPVADLSLNASYGYTKATFKEYNDGRNDYHGKGVPFAPESTLFASCWWQLPITPGEWRFSVEGDLQGAGQIYWNEANDIRQPFYALLGCAATASYRQWQLRLWMKNITDTSYDAFYFTSMSNTFVQKGNPRTFGFTLRCNIGL